MPEINKSGSVCDVYASLPSDIFHIDDNGFLVGRAVVTTIGVFPYLLEDGSVFRELRLPEEVFSDESLNSLRMIPITNDHPSSFVTPDNVGELQVGTTGEDVCRADMYIDGGYTYKTDGTQVSIPLKITDAKAIEDVLGGKRALSCGYSRELELTGGVWCGMEYDGIQRNIRYNHVAIVDRGRAGDTAVIRMDNAFVPTFVEVEDTAPEPKADGSAEKGLDNKEANMPKKELVLDSTPYEVEEQVVDAYNAVVAERDAVKGQLDMANTEIANLKTQMAGMIDAAILPQKVKEYQLIKETADKHGVSLDEGMSELDMKKAILKVVNPAIGDGIDERSEDYINGAFSFCTKASVSGESNDGADDGEGEAGGENPAAKNTDLIDGLNERLSQKYGNRR